MKKPWWNLLVCTHIGVFFWFSCCSGRWHVLSLYNQKLPIDMSGTCPESLCHLIRKLESAYFICRAQWIVNALAHMLPHSFHEELLRYWKIQGCCWHCRFTCTLFHIVRRILEISSFFSVHGRLWKQQIRKFKSHVSANWVLFQVGFGMICHKRRDYLNLHWSFKISGIQSCWWSTNMIGVLKSFAGVDFSNAVLDRVNFGKADLQRAIFKNTVLSGSTFEEAQLQDAVFEDTIIGYIDLQKLCTNTSINAEGRAELGCRWVSFVSQLDLFNSKFFLCILSKWLSTVSRISSITILLTLLRGCSGVYFLNLVLLSTVVASEP